MICLFNLEPEMLWPKLSVVVLRQTLSKGWYNLFIMLDSLL